MWIGNEDSSELKRLFPKSEVHHVGEPRWDRVHSRSQVSNPRVNELKTIFAHFKRPWGVIGSAWIEDMKRIEPILNRLEGTLWIVPHRVDEKSVSEIEHSLVENNIVSIRTSKIQISSELHLGFPNDTPKSNDGTKCIIVDELGFLTELYGLANWAFVGGGFGSGIHSTIEPALYGLPIACGPAGIEKFSEIYELRRIGQLEVISTSQELLTWIERHHLQSTSVKVKWMQNVEFNLGATQKIIATLENFIRPC